MNVKAVYLGKKLYLKKAISMFGAKVLLREPLVQELGKNKYIVFLPYGVAILWNLSVAEEKSALKKIGSLVDDLVDNPLIEEVKIVTNRSKDGIYVNSIGISKITASKVAVISMVLGRSVALENIEKRVDIAHEDFTSIIDSIANKGRLVHSTKKLLKKVGVAMKIQHTIVSQMAMLDKPDIIWEDTALDKFYNELEEEYEIEDRYSVVSEKLKIMFHNIDFILGLIGERRSFILEFIIVVLIFIELIPFFRDIFQI